MIYKGAPGCTFKPSSYKTDLLRHLQRKGWCKCKDAGWTVENGIQGQVDGRTAKATAAQAVMADNHGVVNNNQVNITVNLPPNVVPSGSDAEREYLLAHADDIIRAVVAGVQGPQAEILSNFVNETWCSDTHSVLNNVVALKSNNHEYVRLHMRGDRPKIQTLAGKDAPAQLVDIARQLMLQLAIDVRKGHNPTRYSVPVYKQTYDTREEAEAEQASLQSGRVCQMEVRERGWYWINNTSFDINVPPRETTPLMQDAEQAAWVDDTLKKSKQKRENVAKVVSSQLRQEGKKHDKRLKLQDAAR